MAAAAGWRAAVSASTLLVVTTIMLQTWSINAGPVQLDEGLGSEMKKASSANKKRDVSSVEELVSSRPTSAHTIQPTDGATSLQSSHHVKPTPHLTTAVQILESSQTSPSTVLSSKSEILVVTRTYKLLTIVPTDSLVTTQPAPPIVDKRYYKVVLGSGECNTALLNDSAFPDLFIHHFSAYLHINGSLVEVEAVRCGSVAVEVSVAHADYYNVTERVMSDNFRDQFQMRYDGHTYRISEVLEMNKRRLPSRSGTCFGVTSTWPPLYCNITYAVVGAVLGALILLALMSAAVWLCKGRHSKSFSLGITPNYQQQRDVADTADTLYLHRLSDLGNGRAAARASIYEDIECTGINIGGGSMPTDGHGNKATLPERPHRGGRGSGRCWKKGEPNGITYRTYTENGDLEPVFIRESSVDNARPPEGKEGRNGSLHHTVTWGGGEEEGCANMGYDGGS